MKLEIAQQKFLQNLVWNPQFWTYREVSNIKIYVQSINIQKKEAKNCIQILLWEGAPHPWRRWG